MIPALQNRINSNTEAQLWQTPGFSFELPPQLVAGEPPEARGLARDQVRLMVSHYRDDRIIHTRFDKITQFLNPGDALVINTSGTLKAALPVIHPAKPQLELHLSTHLPGDIWIVELRRIAPDQSTSPYFEASRGAQIILPGGARADLLLPYDPALRSQITEPAGQVRLWLAQLFLSSPLKEYLDRFGAPIRYNYVKQAWPISCYQTVYANEYGSVEMPSAGRAFTPEVITRLVAAGVRVLPLLLHTGVSSLETGELPHEEYYRVPPETARAVNETRENGKRVIATGTTSIRALESVTGEDGVVYPGEGWTRLVITQERKLRAVDGMLTGFHEPRASHLAMLGALASVSHLALAYHEALNQGYLWHEFGDLHLLLP